MSCKGPRSPLRNLVRLDYTDVAVTAIFRGRTPLSDSNAVLVYEAADHLLSTDPVLGEVNGGNL
jgi:hypothetical protein